MTVLVVHRTPLIRCGLRRVLEADERFRVCGETDAAPKARDLFVKHKPRIVALGLTCRGGDGIELIKDFQKMNSEAKILVLSMREDAFSIRRAFRAGASGYLVADEEISEIMAALDEISSGNVYTSERVSHYLLRDLSKDDKHPVAAELKILSDREWQVFSFIGRGFGASQLANELHLSVKTIETHQMHIKRKLGLRSAAELSEKATRWMLRSARESLRLRQKLFASSGSCPQLQRLIAV